MWPHFWQLSPLSPTQHQLHGPLCYFLGRDRECTVCFPYLWKSFPIHLHNVISIAPFWFCSSGILSGRLSLTVLNLCYSLSSFFCFLYSTYHHLKYYTMKLFILFYICLFAHTYKTSVDRNFHLFDSMVNSTHL